MNFITDKGFASGSVQYFSWITDDICWSLPICYRALIDGLYLIILIAEISEQLDRQLSNITCLVTGGIKNTYSHP